MARDPKAILSQKRLLDAAQTALGATNSSAAQFAIVGDDDASVAAGVQFDGSLCAPEHLSPAYCMSKLPLIAGILNCVESGLVDLNRPVRQYIELPFVADEVTILSVMEHQAGLLAPDATTWRMSNPALRSELLPHEPLPPAPGYSDLLSSMVLARIIASVSETSCVEYLTQEIFRPAGASQLLHYGSSLHADDKIYPAIAGLPDRPVPLLSELLPDQIDTITPAVGMFASAEGIARLLYWLMYISSGAKRWRDHIGRAIDRAVVEEVDPNLERRAPFSLGLMANMRIHGLETCSPRSAGHTAAIAGWLAVVDFDTASVRVGYSNGILQDQAHGQECRQAIDRVLLCDRQALGGGRESGIHHVSVSVVPLASSRAVGLKAILARGMHRAVLPLDVRMLVLVQCPDAGIQLLLTLANGGLDDVSVPLIRNVDLVLDGSVDTFAGWLSVSTARLGERLLDGRVRARGDLWAISLMEFWAAKAYA